MAATILLDTITWDLLLDIDGNIAIADEPYSLAQDAASAIKTFLGEAYWDTLLGVPYLTQVLGKNPPIGLLKALFVAQAESVPGVASAKCFLNEVNDRILSGQVQVVPESGGEPSAADFVVVNPQGVG